MKQYEYIVTKVEKMFMSSRYKVELDGYLFAFCKQLPPYIVGDKIISLQHFYNYMDKN